MAQNFKVDTKMLKAEREARQRLDALDGMRPTGRHKEQVDGGVEAAQRLSDEIDDETHERAAKLAVAVLRTPPKPLSALKKKRK